MMFERVGGAAWFDELTKRFYEGVAADPVLTPDELGRILGARPVPVPAKLLRLGADLTWRAHLQPTSPGWVDMGLAVPVMDTTRARTELGWMPRGLEEGLATTVAYIRSQESAPGAD